jgi:aryl-alcohol dehydrogenase-like predicted oxidoreductase
VVEAQWVAERRVRERFRTEQPQYSILARGIEADVLPVCQQYGMGVLSWSPLAGGWLSGAFGEGKANTSRRSVMLPARYDLALPMNQQKLDVVIALENLAHEAGHSLIELALAFVLAHPAVTCPIIGPRTMDQLESQLPAAQISLDGEILDRIDEIAVPGQNVGGADPGWSPPSISDKQRRRR